MCVSLQPKEGATWKTPLAQSVGLVNEGLASSGALRVLGGCCKIPSQLVGA